MNAQKPLAIIITIIIYEQMGFCFFSRWYISYFKYTKFWVMFWLPLSFSVHDSVKAEILIHCS